MAFNLKKFNPLNKNKDQKRDTSGKFTAGSGGLQKLKKFNWQRNAPIIILVALVGGFLVFKSFAGVTKPPAYQYSITTCSSKKITEADVSNPTSAISKCVDGSAEALVYRMQLATISRQGDWAYNHYTQRLAGDRATYNRVAAEMEALPEARWGGLSNKDYVDKVAGVAKPSQRAEWTKQIDQKKLSRDQLAQNVANLFKISKNKAMMPSYRYNNKQFVENIFKQVLKRGDAYVADSKSTWLRDLDSEKYSRAQVISLVTRSSEALNDTRVDVVKYVNSKPNVKIVQVAKQKQDARNKQLASLVSSSKTHYEKGSLHHQRIAANLPSQASATANQARLSRGDLTTIANLQKSAQSHYNYAQQSATNANNDYKKAEKLLADAKAVAKYSTDIPSATAQSSRDKVAVYSAASSGKAKDIKSYITQIANSYKVAESKYESQCNSGTDYNGGDPGCGTPPPPTTPTGGGGGGGDTPDPTGTTPIPTDAGPSTADKQAWCRAITDSYRYHSAARHVTYTIKYHKKLNRTGRACIMDASTKWAAGNGVCDPGYKGGTGTYPTCTPTANTTENNELRNLPKLPYKLCRNVKQATGHAERCITQTWTASKPGVNANYVIKFKSCWEKQIWRPGGTYHNQTDCRTKTGKWDF